jgi:hypothetical protein
VATSKCTPSIEYLEQCFAVTADGALRWRIRPRDHFSTDAAWRTFNTRNGGTIAGTDQGSGYLVVCCGYRRLYAHRVVYALHAAGWPRSEVDHIDGNRANNAPSNLRLATRKQQLGNTARSRVNSSGFKGVARCQNRWRAYIVADRKQKHIGVYDTPEQAAAAYKEAAASLFGDFACVSR